MLSKVLLCLYLLFSLYLNCFSYSYDHLPLCQKLQMSFPELKATCFIIVSKEPNIILHEKNSFYNIRFDDNKKKKSLCDLVSEYSNFNSDSRISGMTFVFEYTNKYKCVFKIALSGINTVEQFQEDQRKIFDWLDQFFTFKVCSKNELLAKIPVIYADIKSVDMLTNSNIITILSDKQRNRIIKTVTYRSIIRAPFDQNTRLGTIGILTNTFEHSLNFDISAASSGQQTNRWKTLLDSIRYLIFGPNF